MNKRSKCPFLIYKMELLHSVTEIASNKYFKPFIAQYIKLYPNEWNGHKSLNWEVIGVPLSKIDEKGLKMFLLISSVK